MRVTESKQNSWTRLSGWTTTKGIDYTPFRASLVAKRVNRLPAMWETRVRSLGWEDPLQKEMVTHSSILAWRIPWTEESSGLQSTGSQRAGYNWETSLSFFLYTAFKSFPDGSVVMNPSANARDVSSIPGSATSPPGRLAEMQNLQALWRPQSYWESSF